MPTNCGSLYMLYCVLRTGLRLLFSICLYAFLAFLSHTASHLLLVVSSMSEWEVLTGTPWCMQTLCLHVHLSLWAKPFKSENSIFFVFIVSMQAHVKCSLNVSWTKRGREHELAAIKCKKLCQVFCTSKKRGENLSHREWNFVLSSVHYQEGVGSVSKGCNEFLNSFVLSDTLSHPLWDGQWESLCVGQVTLRNR